MEQGGLQAFLAIPLYEFKNDVKGVLFIPPSVSKKTKKDSFKQPSKKNRYGFLTNTHVLYEQNPLVVQGFYWYRFTF